MPMSLTAGEQPEGEEVLGTPEGWSDDINMSDSSSTFDQEQEITSEGVLKILSECFNISPGNAFRKLKIPLSSH